MKKRQLGFRITKEYKDKLERVCQENYLTKTNFLKKWIDKEFNQLEISKNRLISNEQ